MNGQLQTTEGTLSWDRLQERCHVQIWDECGRQGDVCLKIIMNLQYQDFYALIFTACYTGAFTDR